MWWSPLVMASLMHRYAMLALTIGLVAVAGIGSSQERAFTQEEDDAALDLPYSADQILVRFEAGTSTDAIARTEKLNGTKTELVLPNIRTRVVDLPGDLSVGEALQLYRDISSVDFATPDYKLVVAQTTSPCTSSGAQTAEYEAGPCDEVEPAPYESPFVDPVLDQPIAPPAAELAPVAPNDAEYHKMWGLDNTGQSIDDPNDSEPSVAGAPDADIDAPEAWGATTGNAETIVAVVDEGVDISHPDLNDNIWTNPDEIPNNNVDDDQNGYVDDVHGWDLVHGDNSVYDGSHDDHGTHVAGTIAAEGNNGSGTTGVSWKSKIMPLKFIDRQPDGRTYGLLSDAARAIDYAVAEGARISNNSYACVRPNCDAHGLPALQLAIQDANSAGHLVVAAAGNRDGYNMDTDQQPLDPAGADHPNVISVAATNSKDTLAPFSKYGATSVDLAAPGENILSTLPDSTYGYRDGTSMAAPHVSGVAALLLGRSPQLTNLQLKDRILQGVDRKAALAGTSATEGRLNAAHSLGVKTTEISILVNPTAVTYGVATELTGKLTVAGTPLSGKSVTLEKRSAGDTTFSAFATVTTQADGSYKATSYPDKHTEYRARFGGERTGNLGASVTTPAKAQVSSVVTLSVATGELQLGRARTITGYVKPNQPYRTVEIVVDKRNSSWSHTKIRTLNLNSRYEWNFKPTSVGVYDITTHYLGDPDHGGGVSVRKGFRVVR